MRVGEGLGRKPLLEGLGRGLTMSCSAMLEALSLSELDKCDRQYTVVGGLLGGVVALTVSALLLPLLFFALTLPATALSRFLHKSVGLGAVETDLLVGVGLGALMLLVSAVVAGRVAWRWIKARSARSGREDLWDLPYQCLARLAPHAGGREVTFCFDPPPSSGGTWAWALEAPLGEGVKVRARVHQGPGAVQLTTALSVSEGEGGVRTWRWTRAEGGWFFEGVGSELISDLAVSVAQRLMGDVSSSLRGVRDAQHGLALWHEVSPLHLRRTAVKPPEAAPVEGELAQLVLRPEAAVVHPDASRASRTMWLGALAYWMSMGGVLAIWGAFAAARLGSAWGASATVSALLLGLLPLMGFLVMLVGVLRYRPAVPRHRPRLVRAPSPTTIWLEGGCLRGGSSEAGVSLMRPFSVALSREERGRVSWALLGVRIYQDKKLCLEFSTPVRRGEVLDGLEELSLTGALVRPERARGQIWPFLRYYSAIHHGEGLIPELSKG